MEKDVRLGKQSARSSGASPTAPAWEASSLRQATSQLRTMSRQVAKKGRFLLLDLVVGVKEREIVWGGVQNPYTGTSSNLLQHAQCNQRPKKT